MRPLTPRLQLEGGGVVIQCTQNQLTLISSNLIEDDAWNQSVIENQQFHSKPCLVLMKGKRQACLLRMAATLLDIFYYSDSDLITNLNLALVDGFCEVR